MQQATTLGPAELKPPKGGKPAQRRARSLNPQNNHLIADLIQLSIETCSATKPSEVHCEPGNNSTDASPAVAGQTEANIVRFDTEEQRRAHAQGMGSEELADAVTNRWGDALAKLSQLRSYLQVLWSRFEKLKGTEIIAGCQTKTEFCEKRLGRSIRSVEYVVFGRKAKGPGNRPGRRPDSAGRGSGACDGGAQVAERDGDGQPEHPQPGHVADRGDEMGGKFIAAAALQIPQRNPKGQVVMQILAGRWVRASGPRGGPVRRGARPPGQNLVGGGA